MGYPKLLRSVLRVERGVLERVDFDEAGPAIHARVRVRAGDRHRCPHCRARCSGYDAGGGRRVWRSLDLGTTMVFLEADAPRVQCPVHGIVVAWVPWARHGSRLRGSSRTNSAGW